MSAIITQKLKNQILLDLLTDLNDSANNYYVAIGRSEEWDSSDTARIPSITELETRQFQYSVQSLKKVAAGSMVIPRYTWSLGAIYSGYNDNTQGHPAQSYYVMNDENQVYICLQQGKNSLGQSITSTVQPTGTSDTAFKTSDGYIWKFLYTIGALSASQFLAASFMPVKIQGATDSDSPAADIEQERIQNAAIAGQITGAVVTNGGSGYTTVPTVTVEGNGTSAKLAATISGGAVIKIEPYDSNGSLTLGQDYQYASIQITGGGGSGAAARPIIGPLAGFGADPRNDLRSRAVMFYSRPDGEEGGDWIVNNGYRQIALIKNPKNPSGTAYTADTGSALYSMQLATISTAFSTNTTIQGSVSQAKAYVDKVDSDTIWYHQTNDTGFIQFDSADTISELDGNGSGTVQHPKIAPDVDPLSGEILYIDNRALVQRSALQAEDVKIIIQL